MLELLIESEGTARREAPAGDDVTLGRSADNDVVLTSQSVSRHHARLLRRGDGIFVEDLGGANGTRLNDRLLRSETAQIRAGDRIGIGAFWLRVQLQDSPAPAPSEVRPQLHIHTPARSFSVRLQRDEVTLGRGHGNDIPIDVPTVSVHHAVVRRQGERWALVDLNSRNGTTLDGHPIEEAVLSDGQVFQLAGAVTITYALGQDEDATIATSLSLPAQPPTAQPTITSHPVSAEPQESYDRTIMLSGHPGATHAVEPTRAGRPADLQATSGAGGHAPGGTLPHVPGAARVTIGRVATNDLVLDSPQVSRHHAVLTRAADDSPWAIADLKSTNRTYVNNEAVLERELAEGDVIRIGPYRLTVRRGEIEHFDETTGILLEGLDLCKQVGKDQTILQNVSLVVQPHEFVAVVGVSGAGKSTLLGALSGLRPATSGQVLLNGFSLYEHFDSLRAQIGYVPQDDIIHRELSVERALDYAARLRMPEDVTPAERTARLNDVLEELGLKQQRTTLISQLSGGQRKRVSIGVELLTSPPLFFLDEPTSGLDPGTETRMMGLLRQLADQGRTILLITHATRNVSICDRVLFLARGGRVAYYGPPRGALGYFNVREFEDIYDLIENTRTPEEWESAFRTSPLFTSEITDRLEHRDGGAAAVPATPRRQTAGPGKHRPEPELLRQFAILTQRYANIVLNDHKNLLILLLQAPVIAVLLWGLFQPGTFTAPRGVLVFAREGGLVLPLERDPQTGDLIGVVPGAKIFAVTGPDCNPVSVSSGAPTGDCDLAPGNGNGNAGKATQLALILAATAVWLGTLNAIREISKEDAIYRRERLVNLRIPAYIASKFAVLFALVVVQSTLLLGITALRIQFPEGVLGLAGAWLSLLLGGAASVAVALTVSAGVSNPDRAVFAAPLLMLPQILFSGLLQPVKDLGPVKPLAALVTTRWAYEAIGRVVGVVKIALIPDQFPQTDAIQGSVWTRWLILLAFVVVFGGLATALQRLKDRR